MTHVATTIVSFPKVELSCKSRCFHSRPREKNSLPADSLTPDFITAGWAYMAWLEPGNVPRAGAHSEKDTDCTRGLIATGWNLNWLVHRRGKRIGPARSSLPDSEENDPGPFKKLLVERG